jgi:hypothetical protein
MSAKHTAGPWHVGKDFGAGIGKGVFVAGNRRVIANMFGDDQLANAHLIAAAPDMLEALKAYEEARHYAADLMLLAADGTRITDAHDAKCRNLWKRARTMIKAAIAKAEGRS